MVSGCPSGSQWVAYADAFRIIHFSQWVASGWLMQTSLGLFVIARGGQWEAYVNSIGFICYSQWVV